MKFQFFEIQFFEKTMNEFLMPEALDVSPAAFGGLCSQTSDPIMCFDTQKLWMCPRRPRAFVFQEMTPTNGHAQTL